MKLTKKKEQEIMQVYDTWMASYLNGDVETYDSYLDDSYHFIGSTDNEEFLNRKNTTQFFKDTAEQFSGKTDLRNQTTTIEAFDDLIFITHLFDAWFTNGSDWTYYGRFRFTSVLQEKKEGWKFIYQHFSIADSKTDEGESIGFDKVNEENQELREAIKRRTVELEQKNRELQIEAALERVRAKSMAMNKSEELAGLSLELVKQVQNLGVATWFCAFNIYDTDPRGSLEWGSNGQGTFPKYRTPREGIFLRYYEAGKRGETLLINEIEENECGAHYEYLCTLPGVGEQLLKMKDDGIPFPKSQIDHVAFFKYGYILFITYEPTPQSHQIFKRFAKVFEQTYTRFLDLQKAEAQAREAQIETALERVRSRSMAMQSSEELTDAGAILYQELSKLGIQNLTTGYTLFDETATMGWNYGVNPSDGSIRHKPVGMNHTKTKVMKAIASSWKKQEPLLVIQLNERETIKHQTFIAEESIDFPISKERLLSISPKRLVVHTFNFKQGYLLIVGGELLTFEQQEMIARFANVFQQTYTRFLDLKKAELQARESKIELGLERVRARAMAMQHSNELSGLVATVLDELTKLDFSLTWCIINIINEADQSNMVWATNPEGGTEPESYYMKFEDYPFHHAMMKAWKEQKAKFVYVLEGKEKKIYDEYLYNETEFKRFSNKVKKANRALDKYVASFTFCNFGGLQTVASEPLSDENLLILERFGKVFDMTYTRFNDLQKAEAQAREAQIEAALERTRTQSMLMQHSDELNVTAQVFHQQLQLLGIDSEFSYLWLPEDGEKTHKFWATWSDTKKGKTIYNNKTVSYPLDKQEPSIAACYTAWESEETVHVNPVQPDKVEDYFNTWSELLSGVDKFSPELFPNGLYYVDAYMKYGCFGIMIKRQLDEAEKNILSRFSKEFQQTYTRFLDLQKAELQAREAQIEAALEKVRSRSLAMHKPDELQEVITVVAEKLQELGVIFDVGGVILCTYFPDNKDVVHWIASPDLSSSQSYYVPYFDNPIFSEAWDSKIRGDAYFSKEFTVEAKNHFFEYAFQHSDYRHFPEDYKQHVLEAEHHRLSAAWSKNSAILIPSLTGAVPSDSDADIMKRFAKVFEQAYIRFMDLQKAEAQAREAQIEAALERVRSRSMAMHKSEEMLSVIEVVSKQLIQLKLNFDTVSFGKNNQQGDFKFWLTSTGQPKPVLIEVPPLDNPVQNTVKAAQKKGLDFIADVFTHKENKKWSQHLITYSDVQYFPEPVKEFILKAPGFARSSFLLKNIDLYVGNYRAVPFTDEENSIFGRFAQVFDQAYTRFLDLEKAEAQTREVQIENALEKVRSRTMAMQHSHELPEAANNLFLQVQELGIPAWSAGYCIWENEDKKTASCNMSSEGEIQNSFILPTIGVGYNFYDPLKKGEPFYVKELGGDALVKHYDFMRTLPKVGKILEELINAGLSLPTYQIFHIVYFPHGYLMFITYEPVPDAHEIFKRFAKVFEQTYTRFLDLQKAEAQAREATKQASLDRVRGQIASMRSTADLDRITPLIWNELTTMGVPFIRCGVFIIDEPTQNVEIYLSAPDGHSLGVLHLQFDADPFTADTVAHWRKGKIFKEHWNREEFKSWTQSLMERGQISDKATYQGAANPPDSLNLHFIPFTQGMLYVGSDNPLNDEQIQLVQSLADAFAIAYARYEDFTKLEKAKQSVEATLSELKATQNQLVQSEKMASLGELTAGIAHEIQNPLNFVNNFSEVSNELIDEMNEEIENGDLDEAKAIANDIKQNLEKINHHGQRADAIVKGMLQHSRSSSGIKEPTDINALADEYLRLAYHGLRAKDKSFNATMNTDFDDTIGKINVVPQDMGRVILNLITNAFYVTNEKRMLNLKGYEPTVTVKTKNEDDKVLVSVIDNGNGIPQKVLDKIFQPFFTTKPTGQGTGLGLSMSYDIITKGHGGELKVETKEGEGTEFKIQLPIT